MSVAARMLVLCSVAGALACGDGVIEWPPGGGSGEGTGNNITVEGNIDNVVLDNTRRDIVVFVYSDLDPNARLPEDLACLDSSDFAAMKTVIVGSGSARPFSVDRVTRGDLTIVFLQDLEVDPDGRIDEEDVAGGTTDCDECCPFECDCCTLSTCPAGCSCCTASQCASNDVPTADNAVAVLDGEGRLSPVRSGQSVDLQDVFVDLGAAAATAEEIVIRASPSGDSTDTSSNAAVATGGGLTIGFSSR